VLTKEGTEPGSDLARYVRQYVQGCPACQKAWAAKPPVVTEPFTLSGDVPMKKLAIDTVGPFPADSQGNTYVVTVVDLFSRYVQLFPAADSTAQAAASAILGHIGYFGVPASILSDNGPQYANLLIEQLGTLTGIDLQKTIAYSHEENGIAERVHKEVLRHLRTILHDRGIRKEWAICLPLIQRIFNATKHTATGCAPAEVITPAVALNEGIVFPHGVLTVSNAQTFLDKLYEKQKTIIRLALETIAKQTERNLRKRKRDAPLTEFPVGSYVLLGYPKDSRPPTKLHPAWQGPYQVLKVSTDKPEYFLLDMITGKTLPGVHVSRLKQFVQRDDTSVRDVARRDTENFVVERILEHRGDFSRKGKRSEREFLVRWLGLGPSKDCWLPWSELRDNVHLHLYLQAQGMSRLIPDKHKNNDYLQRD
jgi:hypothetical protein